VGTIALQAGGIGFKNKNNPVPTNTALARWWRRASGDKTPGTGPAFLVERKLNRMICGRIPFT
jgi:hypothetical protein